MDGNLTVAVKQSLQGLIGTALINRIAPVVAQRLIQMGIEVPVVMLCGNGKCLFLSEEESEAMLEGAIE